MLQDAYGEGINDWIQAIILTQGLLELWYIGEYYMSFLSSLKFLNK